MKTITLSDCFCGRGGGQPPGPAAEEEPRGGGEGFAQSGRRRLQAWAGRRGSQPTLGNPAAAAGAGALRQSLSLGARRGSQPEIMRGEIDHEGGLGALASSDSLRREVDSLTQSWTAGTGSVSVAALAEKAAALAAVEKASRPFPY
jgi:hypothetical protein